IFQGSEELSFKNRSKAWGVGQAANSNGAVYADLDNDGDLDLVVNNINKEGFIYENLAGETKENSYLQVKLEGNRKNSKGIGAKVSVHVGELQYVLEQFPARGYQSSVSTVLHFGLGKATKIDSVRVERGSGSMEKQYNLEVNQRVKFAEKNANIQKQKLPTTASIFREITSPIQYQSNPWNRRDFDRQSLLISELSHESPCMLTADFNKDGLEDVFIGGAKDQAASFYFQKQNQVFEKQDIIAFEQDRLSVDSDAIALDANGDGWLDIYVASGGYHNFDIKSQLLKDRLYLNDGAGGFSKKESNLPIMNSSCVVSSDFNQDGFPDIFLGGGCIPGRYPESYNSQILLNDGDGNFELATKKIASELSPLTLVTDAINIDLNKDGKMDLVTTGEWSAVNIFINEDGTLKEATQKYLEEEYSGFWNTIEVADLNKDGKLDFILGNMGTNIQIKATGQEPAQLFYEDLDKNGSVDPLLVYYIEGKSYPYLTRDELLKQLVSYRSQFTTYESYANVGMNDLFTDRERSKMNSLEINTLSSIILLSQNDGKYKKVDLPKEAQYAPIYSINVLDYNKDGKEDL
ncbi:MAG: FG-GAP-like repeat-containing protein, partial [Bacteroidota bacterium]